jgi:hypothetical protein
MTYRPLLIIELMGLCGHLVYAGGKSRFVSRGGILVNDALLNGFVDQRYGRSKQRFCFFAVARVDRRTKLLYFGTEAASVFSIRFITPFGLPVSFLR